MEFSSVIISFTHYVSSPILTNKKLVFRFWKGVCGAAKDPKETLAGSSKTCAFSHKINDHSPPCFE